MRRKRVAGQKKRAVFLRIECRSHWELSLFHPSVAGLSPAIVEVSAALLSSLFPRYNRMHNFLDQTEEWSYKHNLSA